MDAPLEAQNINRDGTPAARGAVMERRRRGVKPPPKPHSAGAAEDEGKNPILLPLRHKGVPGCLGEDVKILF